VPTLQAPLPDVHFAVGEVDDSEHSCGVIQSDSVEFHVAV
jgi:hypothetical protein